MRTEQVQYENNGWERLGHGHAPALALAQLVLAFGERTRLREANWLHDLRARYPAARIVSCSSGGDVIATAAIDGGLVATAIQFDDTRVEAAWVELHGAANSRDAGRALAAQFEASGLVHVLVFSEGLRVNGSELAEGISESLPPGVGVSGGLAADGERFGETLVGLDALPGSGRVVAVGLYGDRLRVRVGSCGGWSPVGDPIRITKSADNVLHELNGRRALEVYREMLGPLGYGLPASGLLFPLRIALRDGTAPVIRTILAIDDARGTVTFAGDVPNGRDARLMNARLDSLIEAAGDAATQAADGGRVELAIAVSCIGRKLLLQQRTGEELQALRNVFGSHVPLCGFYSYGELAPAVAAAPCELHNQTMTVTVLSE